MTCSRGGGFRPCLRIANGAGEKWERGLGARGALCRGSPRTRAAPAKGSSAAALEAKSPSTPAGPKRRACRKLSKKNRPFLPRSSSFPGRDHPSGIAASVPSEHVPGLDGFKQSRRGRRAAKWGALLELFPSTSGKTPPLTRPYASAAPKPSTEIESHKPEPSWIGRPRPGFLLLLYFLYSLLP